MVPKTIVLFLAACLTAPACIPQRVPDHRPDADIRIFLQGLALSYDGQHDAARAMFMEYLEHHPDDLLARLRMFDDRLFDVRFSHPTDAEYRRFLGEVNDAIGTYERVACAGTDLQGIGKGALDCDYVGAALYSFRMALWIKNEKKTWVIKNHGLLREEDNRFFALANRSHALLAQFLLGAHEYELVTNKPPLIGPLMIAIIHDPADLDDALRKFGAAMGDTSPFVDDVRFAILRIEIRRLKGADALAKRFPLAPLIAALQPRYPHNRIFDDNLDFSDSFESHQ